MLKQIIALCLTLSIFMSSAQATNSQGLKAAFDELNYALTVEWDQKDLDFKNQQLKKFHQTIEGLKAQGLTNAQLLDFTTAQIKNEKVARDLETATSMMNLNQMTSVEATKYVMDGMNSSYNSGASWSGDTWMSIAVVSVIIVAMVLAIRSGNAAVGDGTNDGVYTCSNPYLYCERYCEPAWEGSYIESCWNDCRYICL